MKKFLLLFLTITFLYLGLTHKTVLMSDNFDYNIKEKIIIQAQEISTSKMSNFIFDFNNLSFEYYTWSYNSWKIIDVYSGDNSFRDEMYKTVWMKYHWVKYAVVSKDWKYIIFIALKNIKRFWFISRIWVNSIYILEKSTWKVKQLETTILNEKWFYLEKLLWIQ